jgi:hypothetical protein
MKLLASLASGSAGWESTVTLDCTAEGSADWTGSSSDTIGGVACTITNGANASTFGPDGSTGIVIRTDGVRAWNATTRNAPCLSVAVAAMLTDVAAGQKVGLCVDFATPVDHTTAQDSYGATVEADPTDAAAWGVRLRYQGNDAVDSQALSGGSASDDSTTEVSDIRRMLFIIDTATGYTAVYFSTSAGGSAPPWASLGSWTRLDAGDQTRLRTDNAAQFDITTDVVTMAPASDCGITVTHIHAARYGSA